MEVNQTKNSETWITNLELDTRKIRQGLPRPLESSWAYSFIEMQWNLPPSPVADWGGIASSRVSGMTCWLSGVRLITAPYSLRSYTSLPHTFQLCQYVSFQYFHLIWCVFLRSYIFLSLIQIFLLHPPLFLIFWRSCLLAHNNFSRFPQYSSLTIISPLPPSPPYMVPQSCHACRSSLALGGSY